jgi:Fe-S-cluster containining protein
VHGWTAPCGDGSSSTGWQDLCQTCGACCAAFRVSFYWAEAGKAVADSVPADMTCQVAPLLCAMKGTDQPHPRCIALQGRVGVRVWCSIYERRPSVCHEVLPSGHGGMANLWCDRARAIWGLPPLMHVQEKHERWEIETLLRTTVSFDGQRRYEFHAAIPPIAEEDYDAIVASFQRAGK